MSNGQNSPGKEADLEEKYHQLQANHYQLEDEHFALQHQLKRVRLRYRLFFLLLFIVGIGSCAYFWRGELSPLLPGGSDQKEKNEGSKEDVVTVKRETLRNTLSLTGKIEPRGQVEVVAPLEGKVLEKNFQYGDFVTKGTLLLTLDTSNEEAKYRNAQAEYLEAEDTLKSLRGWKEGLEVVTVRHELAKKQEELKTTRTKLEQTRRLLEKGIVSSSEVDELEESYRQLQSDIAFTKKKLTYTLEKGSEEKVHLVELKKENAFLAMKVFEERMAKAQLMSPMDGVILLPVSRKNEESVELQTGSFVKQDDVLFTIADLGGYNIRAQVDENDILKLQLEQDVTITGDAFQDDLILKGTVQYISFQADKEKPGKASSFSARISVDSPTEEQKKRLLLGMSADMEVLLSEKPDAIIIPFAFVTLDEKKKAWVRKVTGEDGKSEKVPVKIGVTEANRVEILEGLEVGDKIMREPLPPPM
ncbi:MAG: HlyD family efflux transporter periplasmic adaptor subunit [Candidatus Electrothrix aestuarii]|uniref:HlyD family efflux transporter periplasmic adaptor subunit n=1 Tax=Candidatus Electrothrix aestuarii TaxID=3062594 RepID=A0AAU8M1J2_9BACT|nr:HlyD family efflux transporter periplasmic adaptor subunit [Candidatus Electrothrix aestuarii]